MKTKVLLVPGTWSSFRSSAPEWWQPGGSFYEFLRGQDFDLIGEDCPWTWTTDLNGLFWQRAHHTDWRSAGLSLQQYLVPPVTGANRESYIPIRDRNLIIHSHGLQPVLYACAGGLRVNAIITIGSPKREDMWEVAQAARLNIHRWVHIVDPSIWTNKWEWLGSLFDGEFKWPPRWDHPLADTNIQLRGIGHSGVLQDPEKFALWLDNGWFDILKGV